MVARIDLTLLIPYREKTCDRLHLLDHCGTKRSPRNSALATVARACAAIQPSSFKIGTRWPASVSTPTPLSEDREECSRLDARCLLCAVYNVMSLGYNVSNTSNVSLWKGLRILTRLGTYNWVIICEMSHNNTFFYHNWVITSNTLGF